MRRTGAAAAIVGCSLEGSGTGCAVAEFALGEAEEAGAELFDEEDFTRGERARVVFAGAALAGGALRVDLLGARGARRAVVTGSGVVAVVSATVVVGDG